MARVGLKAPLQLTLDNRGAELVRQSHEEKIRELQSLPSASMRVVAVTLADDVATPVAHGLGRVPRFVVPSAIRGAVSNGTVHELRDGSADRTSVVMLKASGFGATVQLDLLVG